MTTLTYVSLAHTDRGLKIDLFVPSNNKQIVKKTYLRARTLIVVSRNENTTCEYYHVLLFSS